MELELLFPWSFVPAILREPEEKSPHQPVTQFTEG